MEDLWEHALTVLEDRDVSELHSFHDETGILVSTLLLILLVLVSTNLAIDLISAVAQSVERPSKVPAWCNSTD